MDVTNRIPELVNALKQVQNPRRTQRGYKAASDMWLGNMLSVMRELAPRGEDNIEPPVEYVNKAGLQYSIPRGRPRTRISAKYPEYAGPILAEAWSTEKTGKGHSVTATISSAARHVNWVILGTRKNHPIAPRAGRVLAFHWGHPLKWPPKDGHGPGSRFFFQVTHPGAKPNRFDIAAQEQTRGGRDKSFRAASRWILFQPLRKVLGKGHVRFPLE